MPLTPVSVATPFAIPVNRPLSGLPARDFLLLEPYLRQVLLDRGMILHAPGEPIEHVYFPHSGIVSLVTTLRNGASEGVRSAVPQGGLMFLAPNLVR